MSKVVENQDFQEHELMGGKGWEVKVGINGKRDDVPKHIGIQPLCGIRQDIVDLLVVALGECL